MEPTPAQRRALWAAFGVVTLAVCFLLVVVTP